jgi:elongator complex protein 3
MFKELFSDERFQPDQIKFYPTVVTKGSKLYRWWKQGEYHPYSEAVLRRLIVECKKAVPEYVRIIRLIRDIPGESIEAGNMVTNLRQILQQEGVRCRCIRCREVKDKSVKVGRLKLNIQEYPASGGQEYFISFDSADEKTLYSFCRLRLPEKRKNKKEKIKNFEFLSDSAMVRELHVYGELVPMGGKKKTQHGGMGKKLLREAEKIARRNNFSEIAVIAGIGVRNYYRKAGYKLRAGYLLKKMK